LKGRPEGEEIKRMSDDCECESKKGKKNEDRREYYLYERLSYYKVGFKNFTLYLTHNIYLLNFLIHYHS
jgi:hypothetical protein